MSDDGDDRLLDAARHVRRQAHAPYSGYRVGAAVLDEHGAVHVGCNVENAAYPQGSCAEANAIGAMIAAGGRRIRALAVVGGSDSAGPCTPCGGCRQRIAEFADGDTRVVVLDDDGRPVVHAFGALLPYSFSLD